MKWFKHMTNMRHDVRMRRLINKYGISGYGLYNAVIESIVETLETENPLPDLEENAQDIATYFNMDTLKVEEILLFCINQGLFDQDEITGRIVCHKVYKFIEQNQTRSEEMRKMITKYKDYHTAPKKITMSETAGDKCEEEKRIEQNRIEKNIYKEILDYWNNKNIINHKQGYITKIKGKINTLLKDYSNNDIKQCIDIYTEIYKSDSYYWTHRWTLEELLQRGFDKFKDKTAFDTYRKSNNKTNKIDISNYKEAK